MNRCRLIIWLFPLLVLSCEGQNKIEVPRARQAGRLEPKTTQKTDGIEELTAKLPDGDVLRYAISVPRGYDKQKPVPLVMALHYGGRVTPFYGRGIIDGLVGPAFAELGAIIVAPDAQGDSPWTSKKNEEAVIWLAQDVMKTHSIDPKKVVVTGFSMGGEGTWYIGSRHQDLFTAAIPVAGQPAGGKDWTIPVYAIHSQKDEVVPIGPAEEHVKALKAKGATVEWKVLTDLTHFETARYQDALRQAVGWLQERWK
jgi:predicted peptidase